MILSKSKMFYAAVLSATFLLTGNVFAMTQKEFMDICLKGDALRVAAALKDEGVSANKADAKGMTPLMMAAQAKGAGSFESLLEKLMTDG